MILHIAVLVGVLAWVLSYLTIDLGASSAIVGAVTSAVVIVVSYLMFLGIWRFSSHIFTLHNIKVK